VTLTAISVHIEPSSHNCWC